MATHTPQWSISSLVEADSPILRKFYSMVMATEMNTATSTTQPSPLTMRPEFWVYQPYPSKSTVTNKTLQAFDGKQTTLYPQDDGSIR